MTLWGSGAAGAEDRRKNAREKKRTIPSDGRVVLFFYFHVLSPG